MATKNFIEELEWRGMIHTIMPGAKEQLEKEQTTAYLGIDPTADSLHIGHLVGVMILKHFQMCGHRPHGPRGRCDGHDRRPLGQIAGAQPARRRDPASQSGGDQTPAGQTARLRLRRPKRRHAGQQLRLDEGIHVPRFHPRHRQVHHRQLHDGQGLGEETSSTARATACRSPSSPTSWCRATTSCTSTRR